MLAEKTYAAPLPNRASTQSSRPSPQPGFHEAPIGTRTERELGASEWHKWPNSYLSSSAGSRRQPSKRSNSLATTS
jgi:hypothetical protein